MTDSNQSTAGLTGTRWRKKPIVIEARQSTGTIKSNREIIEWTQGSSTPAHMGDMDGGHQTLYISTLEGEHRVTPGDWIIRGVKGEHYPCKRDIFALTYELVDEPAHSPAELTEAMLVEIIACPGVLAISDEEDAATVRAMAELALAQMRRLDAEPAQPSPDRRELIERVAKAQQIYYAWNAWGDSGKVILPRRLSYGELANLFDESIAALSARPERGEVVLSASDRSCYEYPSESDAPLRAAYVAGAVAFAASPQPERGEAAGGHYRIEHDGFEGTVIGSYRRLDGKTGTVLQQDGTNIVHVYGDKWLIASPRPPATVAIEGVTDSERDAALEVEHSNAIGVGMVIAAGIIVSVWGDEVQAEEILGAAGLETEQKMRDAGVDDFDIDLCRPVLDHLAARTLKEPKP